MTSYSETSTRSGNNPVNQIFYICHPCYRITHGSGAHGRSNSLPAHVPEDMSGAAVLTVAPGVTVNAANQPVVTQAQQYRHPGYLAGVGRPANKDCQETALGNIDRNKSSNIRLV